MQIVTSQSLLSDYAKCKHYAKLRWQSNLKPLTEARPLRLGTLVDVGLTAALFAHWREDYDSVLDAMHDAINDRADQDFDTLVDRAQKRNITLPQELLEEYKTVRADAQLIARRAAFYLGLQRGAQCPWRTMTDSNGLPLIQYKISFPVVEADDSTCIFEGTLDWCALEVGTGLNHLVDFKVRRNLKSLAYDFAQTQVYAYAHGLSNIGLRVDNVTIIQFRARVPAIPSRNKTRPGMSRQAIATDWGTYREAVRANGFNPDDYLDMQAKLQPFDVMNTEPLFSKYALNIIKEVRHASLDYMRTVQNGGPWYRTRVQHVCDRCPMQLLCEVELCGGDVTVVQEQEYVRKDATDIPLVIKFYDGPAEFDDDTD